MKNIKQLNIDPFRKGTFNDEFSAKDQRLLEAHTLKSGFLTIRLSKTHIFQFHYILLNTAASAFGFLNEGSTFTLSEEQISRDRTAGLRRMEETS